MPANVQNLHAAGSREGFGRVVGNARRAKRLTQQEAADLLGMSRRKILDIEADRIELPRYEKTGILAVLDSHHEDTIAEKSEFTRITYGADGVPVASCGVLLDITSGDNLAAWWHEAVRPLKGKSTWPCHLTSIRTVVWQFEELRDRLKRTKRRQPATDFDEMPVAAATQKKMDSIATAWKRAKK